MSQIYYRPCPYNRCTDYSHYVFYTLKGKSEELCSTILLQIDILEFYLTLMNVFGFQVDHINNVNNCSNDALFKNNIKVNYFKSLYTLNDDNICNTFKTSNSIEIIQYIDTHYPHFRI